MPSASNSSLNPTTRRLFARGNAFLGTEVPILCGAMTWVSTPKLVAAVTQAGGFGALAGGNMPAEVLDRTIGETRALVGDRSFAVNVITLGPAYQSHLDVLAKNPPPVVVFAGGLPRDTEIARMKATGAKVMCFASTESLARRLLSFGTDALILEGTESGGHVGPVCLTVLLQQVLFHFADEVPIFVAGGIGTGRLMAHLMMMGAAGVQMGTRFAVARECETHPQFKEAFYCAAARDAQATGQFDPALHVVAVRALRNEGTRDFERLQLDLIAMIQSGKISPADAQAQIENFWIGGLRRAAVDGDVEHGSVMAGQSVGLVSREETVQEIIDSMVHDCDAEIARCKELLS
ncbi:MAG: nitronate monooxygenase [Victivallales bacterium]|nr:nitronate monooxygenase [Victivallales bacterium]